MYEYMKYTSLLLRRYKYENLTASCTAPKRQHHHHSANELWCRSSDDDDDDAESEEDDDPNAASTSKATSTKKSKKNKMGKQANASHSNDKTCATAPTCHAPCGPNPLRTCGLSSFSSHKVRSEITPNLSKSTGSCDAEARTMELTRTKTNTTTSLHQTPRATQQKAQQLKMP